MYTKSLISKILHPISVCAAPWFCCVLCLALSACSSREPADTSRYERKAELLRLQILTDDVREAVGQAPAGEAGHAVFLSVCDGTQRARVCTGTGLTLDAAWEAADKAALELLRAGGPEPVWVKADVVCVSREISQEELKDEVLWANDESYFWGVSLDDNYDTAFLEAELNGNRIYDYENGGLNSAYINTYLREAGRPLVKRLPGDYTLFRSVGWLCDEEDRIFQLSADESGYGRRKTEIIDRECAGEVIEEASEFLAEQVKEDGSFVYGLYPRFDNEIDNYNIIRHAGTVWSMICSYRLAPDEKLKEKIDDAAQYLISQVRYDPMGRAYLLEAKDDEFKLGGSGVAVVALTEYMDVFEDGRYLDVCRALGDGILALMDPDTGEYYHVLNGDFSKKEEYRTVYYDGEATFALCRLYGATGEQVWLDGACLAAEYFMANDYTQYTDHWISYAMNEITRYIPDNRDYYEFAMNNVQDNLEIIYSRKSGHPIYLELLMATFETYERMLDQDIHVDGLDRDMFLKTIYIRADRMLNEHLYPETAMYTGNPRRILGAFMVRQEGYRIRIDDVQHNIGGFYMYYRNYDRLVQEGMHECRD